MGGLRSLKRSMMKANLTVDGKPAPVPYNKTVKAVASVLAMQQTEGKLKNIPRRVRRAFTNIAQRMVMHRKAG